MARRTWNLEKKWKVRQQSGHFKLLSQVRAFLQLENYQLL